MRTAIACFESIMHTGFEFHAMTLTWGRIDNFRPKKESRQKTRTILYSINSIKLWENYLVPTYCKKSILRLFSLCEGLQKQDYSAFWSFLNFRRIWAHRRRNFEYLSLTLLSKMKFNWMVHQNRAIFERKVNLEKSEVWFLHRTFYIMENGYFCKYLIILVISFKGFKRLV